MKGQGHQGSVTAICRGQNNLLFTCGDDCSVVIWSLEKNERISSWEIGNEKPSCITYLSKSDRLLVADRQLHLWSIENQKLKQTFTGHSSNVTILKYLVIAEKEFVLSASKNDRVLTLWRTKSSSKLPQSYSYLMEDIAVSVATRVNENNFEIAAVTRSGVLHMFVVENFEHSETKSKVTKPSLTIEIANNSAQMVEPIPICTVSMEIVGAKDEQLQIGYGDRQALRFEMIEPDFSVRRQILTRSSAKAKTVANDAAGKKRTANALKTIAPIVNMEDVEFQSKQVVPRKGQKNIEIPMETRLENLTFDSLGQSNAVGRNVAQLLVQALHSHDSNLLRMVFLNKDEQVIRATLKRLPPQYIANLITELTALAQKKTAK